MKIKINEGHTGVMTLKDRTQMNYRVIRVTQNSSKMIFYNGKGLREMFKTEMTEKEKAKATDLKKLDEKSLMKLGHISEMEFANIQSINEFFNY